MTLCAFTSCARLDGLPDDLEVAVATHGPAGTLVDLTPSAIASIDHA